MDIPFEIAVNTPRNNEYVQQEIAPSLAQGTEIIGTDICEINSASQLILTIFRKVLNWERPLLYDDYHKIK